MPICRTRSSSRRSLRGPGAALRLLLAVACVAGVPRLARAQYSQPLFLEAARDPGRAEPPLTARSLALGGVRAASGSAEDAVGSAATLAFGSGTDLVVSGGVFRLARNELVATPSQLPPWDPARARSPWSGSAVGLVAAAGRRAGWAAAAFFDASGRYDHSFATERATLAYQALQGTSFSYRGQGRASASVSTERLGGALARTLAGGRLSVGASVYAVRLAYQVSGDALVEAWSKLYTDPQETYRYTWNERDEVAFRATRPGWSVSAAVTPRSQVMLTARWTREPAFDTTRVLSVTGGLSRPPVGGNVRFEMPDTWAVGARLALGRTLAAGEVARTGYSVTFGPETDAGSPPCQVLTSVYCDGWGFTSHRPADSTSVRLGLEQRVGPGSGRGGLLLRGGLAFEQGYWLGRAASDSGRNGQTLPAPPIVSDYEPPRDAFTWVTAGAAYRRGGVEIGAGAGYANHQLRLLVDLRLGSAR
jgi:hypothetical protein